MPEQPVPYPPDPPASFGALGPEHELVLPTLETGPIESQSPVEKFPEQQPPATAKFVPKRRASQPPKPKPTQQPAQSKPRKVPTASHYRLRSDGVKRPAPTATPISKNQGTQFTDLVQDPWKRYLDARKRYKEIVKTAHQEYEQDRRGNFISAGAGMHLYEWELNTGSGRVNTVGAHARMKRGPQDKPVVLEVISRSGAVTKLSFTEGYRAGVKSMAAAIRKRGKVATYSAQTDHATACRNALRAKLEKHHAQYAAAANGYAASAELAAVPSMLPRILPEQHVVGREFVKAVIGPRLKGPRRELRGLIEDPRVISAALLLILFVVVVVASVA